MSAQPAAPRVPTVTLNDGVQMPLLGFGTSGVRLAAADCPDRAGPAPAELEPAERDCYRAVRFAIRCGYRFFDTAALYGNERAVGRAVRDALGQDGLERRDLFVCTKVWNTAHQRASVVRACRASLARLGLDYVDLYLVHWPVAYDETRDEVNPRDPDSGRLLYADTHFTDTWLGMQDVRDAGLARSIGLSNFNRAQIAQLLAMPGLRHAPSVLQVELHPYLAQKQLHELCARHRIALNAYCPLGAPGAAWLPAGQARVIDDPLIGALAERHGKSPAQIILRYHVERGVAPIPKSNSPARIRANIDVFDFSLAAGELEQLLALDRSARCCLNTAGEYVTDHPLYPFHEAP